MRKNAIIKVNDTTSCITCPMRQNGECVITKANESYDKNPSCPKIPIDDFKAEVIAEYRESIKIMDIRDCYDIAILRDRIYELHETINFLERENQFNRGKVEVFERLCYVEKDWLVVSDKEGS